MTSQPGTGKDKTMWRKIGHWWRTRRSSSRRLIHNPAPSELSDFMLDDIGLNRGDLRRTERSDLPF